MRILVTGGAGYIGSNTVSALISDGFEVVVVDDLSTGFKQLIHPEAEFIQANILDTSKMAEIMSSSKIDGIIHFAAKIVVPESISHPLEYYHNNTMGVISVLSAAKQSNVKNFVFSSTAAVYGNDHKDLISETAFTNPINPYGKSKLFSEHVIRDSEVEFGLRSVIFRYFNVAGASVDLKYGQCSKNATHLIKIASEAASLKRDFMNITGTDYNTPDGTGVRDYIHVSDLAHAHVLGMKYLFNGGESEIFNCGYGKGSSVKEVVSAVKKVSGVDFKVHLTERRPGDADSLVSNPSKLKRMLSWEPKYNDLEFICKTAFLFEKNLS